MGQDGGHVAPIFDHEAHFGVRELLHELPQYHAGARRDGLALGGVQIGLRHADDKGGIHAGCCRIHNHNPVSGFAAAIMQSRVVIRAAEIYTAPPERRK